MSRVPSSLFHKKELIDILHFPNGTTDAFRSISSVAAQPGYRVLNNNKNHFHLWAEFDNFCKVLLLMVPLKNPVFHVVADPC